MASPLNKQFYLDQLENVKAQIIEFEEALVNFEAGAINSYTFDSGQTRQTVTRNNLGVLRNYINALYNRAHALESRAGLSRGTFYAKPHC